MYIDTHAHMLSTFFSDVDATISMSKKTVGKVVSIGTNIKESIDCLEIAKRHQDFIFSAIGLHPEIADDLEQIDAEVESLELLIKDHREMIVALGEIGLDYHYGHIGSIKQKRLLEEQIKLALSQNLPIIIHCREAFSDLIPILENHGKKYKGVIHSFDGNIDDANILINMGFYLSFNGIITFKNADRIRDVATKIPLEKILLETDSPFLSPVPLRGTENYPGNIKYTYDFMSDLKEVSLEKLQKQMETNTRDLFGI